MQTYPQYYPQMNNYGQQYNPQQKRKGDVMKKNLKVNTITKMQNAIEILRETK